MDRFKNGPITITSKHQKPKSPRHLSIMNARRYTPLEAQGGVNES